MALNLKTFGTRSLSAAVFVALLLGSVLWNYYSFSVFFFVVAMGGLFEFFRICEKLNARPLKTVGYFSGALTYLAFINTNYLTHVAGYNTNYLLPLLTCVPFLILSGAVFQNQEGSFRNALFTIAGVLYAVLPMGLLHEMVFTFESGGHHYFPYTLVGIIFLIWSNDTFAYIGGSLLGKNKMIERISPGKTWEGTIVGVLVTFGVSFLIGAYLVRGQGLFWPLAGIAVPVMATIGDLVESVIKRQAGIKDTGNIMPGHGGVLDRFDSFIFVTPFVVAIVKLIALQSVSA